MQNLLIQAATEHQLPPEYQTYLKSHPAFTADTSRRAKTGTAIFQFLWMGHLQRIMRWIKSVAKDEDGNSPRWTGTVVWATFNLMWLYHDWIHARIWGRGDGR